MVSESDKAGLLLQCCPISVAFINDSMSANLISLVTISASVPLLLTCILLIQAPNADSDLVSHQRVWLRLLMLAHPSISEPSRSLLGSLQWAAPWSSPL